MVNTITGESSLLSGKSRKNGSPWTRLVWPDSELPAACHPSGQLQLVSAPSLGPFSGPGTVMIDRADSGVRWPRDTVCKPSYLLCEMRPSSLISTKGLEPTLGWQTGLFPTPCPGTSLWDLDIEHGRTVDTVEIANLCLSGLMNICIKIINNPKNCIHVPQEQNSDVITGKQTSLDY